MPCIKVQDEDFVLDSGALLEGKFSFTSDKVDRRATKTYCRDLSAHVSFRIPGGEAYLHHFCLDFDIEELFPLLKDHAIDQKRYAIDVVWNRGLHTRSGAIWLKFRTKLVERPSLIPSEDETEQLFGEMAKTVWEWLRDQFASACLKAEQTHNRHVLAKGATWLLQCLQKEIVEKAKKSCRFEQRLAGLLAEFEAEKKVIMPLYLKDLEENGITLDGKEINPLVAKVVAENLPSAIKGAGQGGFMLENLPRISAEDLT